MPRAKCPLCESPVRLDEMKPYARLSCGKCHADLHLSREGRLLMGDPPDVENSVQELRRELRRLAGGFPVKKIALGLAGTLCLAFVLYQLFGPAERLDLVAEKAAQALADGDPDTLKSLADPETADEVGRWYETVHPRLVRLRNEWGAKAEVVGVQVAQEDKDQHKGAVGIMIQPSSNGARDVSLADPSNATATASTPFSEVTDWTLTRWGRWKLDGRAILARVPQTLGAR